MATCLLLLACTGDPGRPGVNGADGAKGDPGAAGPQGPAAAIDTASLDDLAAALAGNPELRQAVAQILADQHANELRGAPGAEGVCDCGEGGGDAFARDAYCYAPCQVATDCAGEPPLFDAENYECLNGACRWVGCLSDDECGPIGAGFMCR